MKKLMIIAILIMAGVLSQICAQDQQQKPAGYDTWSDAKKKMIQHYWDKVESYKKENQEIKNSKDPKLAQQVVMFGDSITEGFNLKEYFPGQPFVNRGIVADHVHWEDNIGLLYRYKPEVLAPNPAHIFILIGINEIGDGRTDADIEKYIGNYKSLLGKLKETHPNVKIHVQSVLPARDKYKDLNPAVVKFNEKLQALAKEFKINYIDLNTLMKDESGDLKADFSSDGIHLKKPAYDVWAKVIRTYLTEEVVPADPEKKDKK